MIKGRQETENPLNATYKRLDTMKGTLSTTAVARLLKVAVGSIVNWIDKGDLKAGRTPGGHRRIEVSDLIEFLARQNLPIPPELTAPTKRILVVDDEPVTRRLLAGKIQEEFPEYEVLEAHDGFSAGEIIGSLKPAVVILDLRMPGMDGFEVCRRLKSKGETKNIVVIAITAYESEESEKRILDYGAKICLTKPVDIRSFLEEVRRALTGTA